MTRNKLQKVKQSGDVSFLDEMPSKPEMPQPPVHIRALIFWMLFAGIVLFGGIGTWAAFAPIQSAVIASGSFEIDGDLQVVQHLEGGIVRQIEVREGDRVKTGQIIAILDGTRAQAQIGILNNQLCSALAREDRLRAEYKRADNISFSQELLDMVRHNPSFEPILSAQTELFGSNRITEDGRVAILSDRINQLSEQLVGILERRRALGEQHTLVSEEVEGLQNLLEMGLTTKSRFVARRQIQMALSGEIGQSESTIQSVYQQISEIEERMLQARRDRNLTIADDLQNLQEQVFSIRQRLDAANEVANRLNIRAPISGRIVGFELNTIGEVIQPGQTILEIVPEDSSYVVEARVQPSDIDEIVLGGRARVRMTSYSYRTTPLVEGTVKYVSADTFFDASSEETYYRVHIEIPDQQFADLPNVQAVPSMPAQVMIATGEQTVITYLLNPILGGLETAMVESE